MIREMRSRSTEIARRLFGSGPFGRLVVVHTVTDAADALFTVSLAGSLFFGVSADAARPRILLYLLLTLAPFAVLGPFVAPIVDRVRGGYRFVILATAAGRCIACAALAGTLNSLLFFPVAFAVLVLGRTYSVAKSSLVARLVDDERRLVASNAQLARMGTVGAVIGGLVGAGLLGFSSAVASAAGAAIAHAAALVVAWRLPRRSSPRRDSPGLDDAELHQTRLTFAATAMGVLRSAIGFAAFLVALVLKTSAEPAWVFGVALLAGAVGGFAGTMVAGPLRRHIEEQTILVTCLGAVGLVCFVATAASPRIGAAALAGAVAMAASVGRQAFDSLTQRLAPDAEKGRAFAGFELRFELAWVVGGTIAVIFEPSLSVGLVATGAVALVASIVYGFGLRELRGAQLIVPIDGWGEGDRLASSIVAVARAAAAQGADRMAIVLAHEAAQLCSARQGALVAADDLLVLARLWQQAAAGGRLDPGAADQATAIAAHMVASATAPPPSG
jgi:hypothetical protein